MRSATRIAALLLTIVFAAAGCKPSSLSPFWIGEKGLEDMASNINGVWEGATASGGVARFLVGNNEVSEIILDHRATGCVIRFQISGRKLPVVDDDFAAEVELENQGRFVIAGRFASASVCTGSYLFEGTTAASTCPTSGSGQFSTLKQ